MEIIKFDGAKPSNVSAKMYYYDSFFSKKESDFMFKRLYDQVHWREEKIKIFGKRRLVPRLIAWYGDEDAVYTYSGAVHQPLPWISILEKIKNHIQANAFGDYNSVLLNLYRDGNDSMGWHCDNEKELGDNPVIASVSFGASRYFSLKDKNDHATYKMLLESGSLLMMYGDMQECFYHSISKTKKCCLPRINLTFRKIKGKK